MFRNANPSNLSGSLLEGSLAQSGQIRLGEARIESLKKCIGELERQTEEQKLAL